MWVSQLEGEAGQSRGIRCRRRLGLARSAGCRLRHTTNHRSHRRHRSHHAATCSQHPQRPLPAPTSRRTSSTSSALISLAWREAGASEWEVWEVGMRRRCGNSARLSPGRGKGQPAAPAARGLPAAEAGHVKLVTRCAASRTQKPIPAACRCRSPWRLTCRRTSAQSFCRAQGAPRQRRPCLAEPGRSGAAFGCGVAMLGSGPARAAAKLCWLHPAAQHPPSTLPSV